MRPTARSFAIPAALALAAILPTVSHAGPPADATEATKRWWSRVEILSSDDMRGRQTGSPEHRRAAEYVARELKSMGWQPGVPNAGGAASYLQPVPFIWRKVREPECSLELVTGDKHEKLVLGEQATLSMGVDSAPEIDAPLVFIGYGVSAPDAGYDDFANVDLKGKIAVIIGGGPGSVPGPRRAHALSTAERTAALRKAGAIGTLRIGNPHNEDVSWANQAKNRLTPGMVLADSTLVDSRGMRFSGSYNAKYASALFAGAPHTFEEIVALADSSRAMPTFALAPRLVGRIRFDQKPIESQNVVGILPGRDPKLRSEYVVLTAHLDHLGVGGAVEGDSIYNGTMDNASGVASLLEVASKLSALPASERPARSILLVCVTGEEKGLLGSHYYAERPTVPAGSMIADVNVDMLLTIVPLKNILLHGQDESDLGERAAKLAGSLGIGVLPDPNPNRRLFIRSDQYSFIRFGIPAVAPSVAAPPDSPADSTLKRWIRQRYHQPSDDLAQPIDGSAPGQVVDYVAALVRAVADDPARPRWKDSSFFKRFAAAP